MSRITGADIGEIRTGWCLGCLYLSEYISIKSEKKGHTVAKGAAEDEISILRETERRDEQLRSKLNST